MEKLIATIQRYRFFNEENGYSIAMAITNDDEMVTVVGYFPKLSSDILYEFQGKWIIHPKFGRQFEAETFEQANEQTKSGLVIYLSSDHFIGIGEKTATKIVDLLGMAAIEKIVENPKVLSPILSNPLRRAKFHQQLVSNQMVEKTLIELYNLGLTPKMSMRIINQYQKETLQKLSENPYELIKDVRGIAFTKADEIAKKFGIVEDDPRRIKAGIVYALESATNSDGNIYLTKEQLYQKTQSLLEKSLELDDILKQLIDEKEIILEREYYYLAVNYYTEIGIASNLNVINSQEIKKINSDTIAALVKELEEDGAIKYTNAQTSAIETSINHSVSIITGGPGTGKTTIIAALLFVYGTVNQLDYQDPTTARKIALAAPTGRAAKRMQELLGMEASTIHRLLGYDFSGDFHYTKSNPLPHDLIIIDEASMIDMYLFKALVDAIKPDAQLLIVGDVDQIPSVGPGKVLGDLIGSGLIATTRLIEVHRQAAESEIITLASKINRQSLQMIDLESKNDLFIYQANAQMVKEKILDQIHGAMKNGYSIVNDIQVLAPIYRGELGIDVLNQLIQDALIKSKNKKMHMGEINFYIKDKVIQLVNDPKRFIMNGDIGYIENIEKDSQDKTFMTVLYDQNKVIYYQEDLPELSLAYAISIHKSQGSEYPIVIMPILRNYLFMLRKELIYTAITRAKQYLMIFGDRELLLHAANRLSDVRQTTLQLRLTEFKKLEKKEDTLSPYDFM